MSRSSILDPSPHRYVSLSVLGYLPSTHTTHLYLMSTILNTEYSPNLSSFSPSSCPKCYEASTKKLLASFPGCFTAQAKLPRLGSASSVDRSKSKIGWWGSVEPNRSRPIPGIGKGNRTQTLPTQPATTKEQRRRRSSTNSSSVYPESRIDPTQRVLSILNRGSTRPERDGILQSAWNTYSDGLNVLVESEKQYETVSETLRKSLWNIPPLLSFYYCSETAHTTPSAAWGEALRTVSDVVSHNTKLAKNPKLLELGTRFGYINIKDETEHQEWQRQPDPAANQTDASTEQSDPDESTGPPATFRDTAVDQELGGCPESHQEMVDLLRDIFPGCLSAQGKLRCYISYFAMTR